MTDTDFAVYLYSDSAGQAIYVGYTGNLPVRLSAHQNQAIWWTPDLRVTFQTYPTEAEALEAETDLIRHLRPLRNRRMRSGPASRHSSRPDWDGVRSNRRPAARRVVRSRSTEQHHTVDEVAEILSLSPGDVRELTAAGDLSAFDIGIRREMLRISDSAIETYRRKQQLAAAST